MKTVSKLFIGLFIVLSAIGCATATPQKMIRINYDLDPATPSPQTKNDVTIKIEYVDYNDIYNLGERFPYLKGTYEKPDLIWGGTNTVPTIFNPFSKKAAFYVEIKNGTDHILRMGDARIFFVIGEESSPALEKTSWLIPNGAIEFFDLYKNPQFKVINDLSTEVLPGFSTKGFLCFNIEPQNAVQGTLSFFDITTKVDKTGTALEKTRFDFKVTQKVTQAPAN